MADTTTQLPRELIEQFARGNGVIFVGAGLSVDAGLPSCPELVRELVSELDGCPPDADYREIAQYYDIEHGRTRLVQKLRERFDTLNVCPTPVHEATACLPVSSIFTTSYDDLLEQTLRAAKRPFASVIENADASFWSADRLQLVKLHGDLSQPESIVITAKDYERFAIQHPTLARLLATTLQTRTVLFLGYSATDPDFRLILTQVHDESGQFARNLYAVQFGAPGLVAKDLEQRGLKMIDLGKQLDAAARNSALGEWLQALNKQVATESTKIKPPAPPKPQTVAQVLAGEIQVWLGAMGYTVAVQPCDERCIDLDAILQRGLEEQHVLVRCVAGEVTVTQLETLEQDIAIRSIPKAWAVSDRRVPPSAQSYADTHPSVRPFSLTDFVTQIFGPYFGRLRQLVEESDISRYYVDLACYCRVLDKGGKEMGRDHYDVIDAYVDDWLKARDANHLSILGEFGSGKTWFCRHYAYRQLERYLADPVHERLPILITLRDYVKQVEVSSLIRKLLDEQGVHLGGGLEAFEELNRRGKLLLIFDGFDEMAVKVDYQTVVDYFSELSKVVVPGSKALLTCRTPYFRYATEAEQVMHGEELGRKTIVIQPPRFVVAYLEPFTDEQIREVITRRHGEDAAQAILHNSDLVELARQPVLIEMLMEALPDIKPGAPINKSQVYCLAVDRWLERDIGIGRTFMNKWDKLFFMMELAWEMLSTGNLKIHYKDLPERINIHFGLEKQDEKDHYDYDIRTKSFLRRDAAGYYEFMHRSLVEYFVALKFTMELGVMLPQCMTDMFARKQAVSLDILELRHTFGLLPFAQMPVVCNFTADLVEDVQVLWKVIEATKNKSVDEVGYIGSNAATILNRKGQSFAKKNLSCAVLPGVDLRGAVLVQTSLNNAVLINADLRYAKCTGAVLEGANFQSADVSGANFREGTLDNVDLSSVKSDSVNFTLASLDEADLSKAQFTNSRFVEASLVDVKAIGSEMTRCDFTDADCSMSSFRYSSFAKCNFTGTEFERADLRSADLESCTFDDTSFAGAKLYDTNFQDKFDIMTVTFDEQNWQAAVLHRSIRKALHNFFFGGSVTYDATGDV